MKTKIKIIVGIIVITFFAAQLPLFNILYPAVSDPDYWVKSHQAMVEIAWCNIISIFLIGCYTGWIFYDLNEMRKKTK